jgi:hypothetical protein
MVAALHNAVHALFILMAILSDLAHCPVSAIRSAKVTTIEGLSKNGDHPVQLAWDEVGCSSMRVLPGRANNDCCGIAETKSQTNTATN